MQVFAILLAVLDRIGVLLILAALGWAGYWIYRSLTAPKRDTPEDALRRTDPEALTQLLAPVFEGKEQEAARKSGRVLTRGLNAGPGAGKTLGALLSFRQLHQQLGGALRVIVSAGAYLPPDLQQAWEDVGIIVLQG